MFAIFIICAWSLTLAASTGLLLFGTSTLVLMLTSAKPIPFIIKMLSVLTKPLFAPVYGNNAVFYPSAEPANKVTVITWLVIAIVVAIVLITLSIIELVRLRKHQKVSKPFVKVTLVITGVLLLLTGQLIFVIVASLILIAFIMLEVVLFDSEALNNYAEERNLISIYKEERKFEKEVSKEGKLTGNVDLKNQIEDFQEENDQTKVNDNSALPKSAEEQLENFYKEGKAKKYYLKWKDYKAKLEIQRKQIEANMQNLNEKELTKVISKFNFNVMKVNRLGAKLRISQNYSIEYMTIDDNTIDANFKSTSISEATTAFGGEESTSVDEEIEKLHERYSGGNKPGVPQTFVAPQTIVHGTSIKAQGLEAEFIKEKMAKAVNMTIEQLPESSDPANSNKDMVYSDFNFDQPDLAAQVIMKDMKKVQDQKQSIVNATPGTTISAPPSFEIEVEKEIKKGEVNEVLGTFVAPQTIVHGTSIKAQGLEAEFIKEKMAKAVNMTIEQLPESSDPANSNKDMVYSDFNFDQPDLAAQVIMKDMKKAQEQKEEIANGAPGTTVSTLPVFETNMILGSDQKELEISNEDKVEEFIAPQTLSHDETLKTNGLEEEFVREKMARAVNMDLSQLDQSDISDSDKDMVYSDFNFDQPDLAAQVIMKEMKETGHQKEEVVNINSDTTISTPPIFNESVLENISDVINPVSFEPEMNYEEEYGLSGANSPAISLLNLNENVSNTTVISQTSNIESIENHNDVYEKPQVEIKESSSNKVDSSANSVDLEKLNSIEKRMSKLENLIENLGNKLNGDRLSEDFSKISQQLDSISKMVNDLENNTPRAIIDSLSTRHNYNKNNG
ncbi:DUF3054 domain-containing protein [Spiroplasma diminutum]|uniref:Transmembrane protein n=1 Tax=Spiroplasma diminutum CUAS-1 TaxID=1276221 RepID=S5MKL1_9MOLU|nr:DUF3054 domain-containing protein [Spiroplasma diminutum]AGR42510.1 hypothetical protein SDIMI_v3c08060 [Spiroplasma diminutum CUAS-1]